MPLHGWNVNIFLFWYQCPNRRSFSSLVKIYPKNAKSVSCDGVATWFATVQALIFRRLSLVYSCSEKRFAPYRAAMSLMSPLLRRDLPL